MVNPNSDSRSNIETRQFTFAELPDYSDIVNSKPTRFKTPQGSYDVNSWRKVYRLFCVYVMNVKPRHLKALKNLEETFLGRRVMFSGSSGDGLIDPFKLSAKFYAELNLSARSIVHNIIHIIQFCRLSPRQFVVTIPVYIDESELSEPEEVEDEQNEVESQLAEPEQSLSQIAYFTLDDDIPDLAFSKPVSITINTRRYSVSKWRDIVSETARYVYENDSESFLRYLYKNFGPKGNSRPLFSDKRSNLLQASRIDSNLYVETNFSSVDCVKKALLFIRYANIAPSKIQIEYLTVSTVDSDNPIPAESANINTEPEEGLEDSAVVDDNASEQSQAEKADIKSENNDDDDVEFNNDLASGVSDEEEFDDEEEDDFDDDGVDIGYQFYDNGKPVITPSLQKLIDAIEEKYPEGIDLEDSDCIKTIENESGVRCNEDIIDLLKMTLLEGDEGIYYVPMRIVDDSTVSEIAAFITNNVNQHGALALSALRNKFHNIWNYAMNDDDALADLIEWYVNKKLDWDQQIAVAYDYSDNYDDGVCLPENVTLKEFYEELYDQIEQYLQTQDRAVSLAELCRKHPYLNDSIITYALDGKYGDNVQEESKDGEAFFSLRSYSQLDEENSSEPEQAPELHSLSFSLDEPIPQLSYTKPIALTIGDKTIELNLWREVITETAEYLFEYKPASFDSLIEEYGKKSKFAPLFSRNRSDLEQSYYLNSQIFVETKYDASGCVRQAKKFLNFFNISLSEVRIEYLPAGNANVSAHQQKLLELKQDPPELTQELQTLLKTIEEKFPRGVNLEDSKNILESASGVECSRKIISDLKYFLFESVKGLFYLSSQITDELTLNDMAEFIDQQIKQFGAVAISVVRDKFRYRLKFIISEDNEDLTNFVDKQVNPRLEQKVQIVYKGNRKSKEKGKYSICLSESTSEKQFDKDISLQIKQYLQECNWAVPMYELCNQFPHLDETILAFYLDKDENEYLDDVFRVSYEGDKTSYYRTIDSLYLKDDFSKALTQAVAQLESNGGTATLATIAAKLDEYYNLESEDGSSAFREQFDLTDDDAFRYVVLRRYAGEVNHKWGTKTRFIPETSTGSIKLYDEFKKQYPICGVFHENLFFEFATKKTGNYNTAALALAYLRPYCIRLDIDHWIDIQPFKEQSNFSPELASAITERLTQQLGSRPFLSLGLLSNSFFEELPELRLNDRLWQWNEYLLTSVSALLIDDLVIVNEEPNAYQVTALLLPASIPIPKDVIEYAVKYYKQQNGSNASIDGAIDFLKQNRIRMKKTAKLEQQLEDLLKEG